ncbi:MAG: hypothetical protein KF892_16425 [Rhizobacter sp.]|nr:hypothetical protein [Rhizobacter sp.]
MKIENRKARLARARVSLRALAIVPALGLISCGGGGGGDDAPPPALMAGDYYVYDYSFTPAGSSTSSYRNITTISSVAPDGTNLRVGTSSLAIASYTAYLNSAQVGYMTSVNGSINCQFSPPAQVAPPSPRSVGQSWSVTSTTSPSGCNGVIQTTQSGQVVAREAITVPAGTFETYRVTRQASNTLSATTSNQQTSTCWYAVDRGYVVRCDFNTTTTTSGSITTSTSTQVLSAIGGPVRASQGSTVSRFQGAWRVGFNGGVSGNCPSLLISSSGNVSGTCNVTGGASFTVAGTVTPSGSVSLSLSTGGSLTGSLSTPYAGSGTWVDSGTSGSWTASHQ